VRNGNEAQREKYIPKVSASFVDMQGSM